MYWGNSGTTKHITLRVCGDAYANLVYSQNVDPWKPRRTHSILCFHFTRLLSFAHFSIFILPMLQFIRYPLIYPHLLVLARTYWLWAMFAFRCNVLALWPDSNFMTRSAHHNIIGFLLSFSKFNKHQLLMIFINKICRARLAVSMNHRMFHTSTSRSPSLEGGNCWVNS